MILKINNTLVHQLFEKRNGLGFKNLLLSKLLILLHVG